MANPVDYSQLFNGLGPGAQELAAFENEVRRLNKTYRAFTRTMDSDAAKLATDLTALNTTLAGVRNQVAAVNVANETERTTLAALSLMVQQLVKDQEALKRAQEGQARVRANTEQATKGINSELRKQQQLLKDAYAANDMERARAYAQEVLRLKQQTEELNRAMRGANSTLTAAAGSYRALENEARQLELKLRSLEGGMEATSDEAMQMKARLADVNAALIGFGKETNNGRANVGRYAEDIRLAVGALEKERIGLLANINALRTQAQATGLTAEQQGKLRKELDSTQSELEENTKALRSYGVAAKGADEANAGQSSGLKRAGLGLQGFAGNLASAYFGLTALTQVVGGAFSSYLEFEQAQSRLSAITGATGDDLKFFAEQAQRIGPAVGKSAADTLKAFELIGSAQPQLLKNKEALAGVTEQALLLASAAGDELPAAAAALTSIMNQFQAPAEQAARYVNALAAGAKEGAATIPETAESIKYFGVNAARANLSVEQSVALVQTLAERSLKGEQAGTKLRNILAKLASGARELNPEAVGLEKALDNLGKKNLSTAQLTKMFGLENASAAAILIDSREKVRGLTTALTGTETATEQAAAQLDNVASAGNKFLSILGSVSNGLFGRLAPGFRVVIGAATELVQKLFGLNKSFADNVAASGSLIQNNQRQAQSANELLQRYVGLTEMGIKPTAKEKRELDTITLKLRDSLGESVTSIDKETGALKLNVEEVRNQIKQRLLLANQEASSLVLRANAAKERQQAADLETKRLERELKTRREILKQEGIKSDQLAKELFDASLRNPDVKIYGASPAGIRAADAFVETQGKVTRSIERSRAASQEYAAYIGKLNELGFDETFYQKALAGALDTTTAAQDRNTDSAKKQKQAVADVAAEEFKRQKQILEARIADLDRQAGNVANSEDVRTRAIQKAAATRIELAKLEYTEGVRLAKQSNAKKIDGDKAAAVAGKTLYATFKQQTLDIERSGNQQLIALRNATLDQLARVEKVRIDDAAEAEATIRDNENNSYEQRMAAARRVVALKVELAQLEAEMAIRAAKGDQKEIDRINKELEATTNRLNKSVRPFNADFANNDLQKQFTAELTALEQQHNEGLLSEREYRRKLRKLNDDYHAKNLENLKKDTEKQREAGEEELADAQRVAAEKQAVREEEKRLLEEIIQESQKLVGTYFDYQTERRQRQLEDLQYQKEAELQVAGDNAALKTQIEENYQKRSLAIRRQQAKQEKLQAIFSIAISTAVAAAQINANPAVNADITQSLRTVLTALVIANGLAQLATVVARPLPTYFRGRQDGPAEWAIVGDRGPELVEGRSGGARLVAQPTVTYLHQGDKVHTAAETSRILADYRLVEDRLEPRRQLGYMYRATASLQGTTPDATARAATAAAQAAAQAASSRDTDRIIAAFNNRPEHHYHLTGDGLRLWVKKGNSYTEHINRRYRRNG